MKMKIIYNVLFVLALFNLLTGCGKDNYDEPESFLVGKVTYNGESLHLRGTGEAIRLQLYQDGYAKHDPISVFVGQDGDFSANLFAGEYKLVTRDGNGPWINKRDTIHVKVKGTTTVEMAVTPYFLISNENITASSTLLNATFTINQIVSTTKIQKAMLILSKTQFADDVNNLFRKDFTNVSSGTVSLSADISGNQSIEKAKALYARVGVQAVGADQAIYSPVIRLR